MLVTNRGFDDPRVCAEAGALARAGRAVTVVGWDRESDHDVQSVEGGTRFWRLALRSTHGRGLTQPVFLSGFWLRAMCALRRLRPRAIHCHDLDTLPLGLAAGRMLHARVVFDAHENYPDMMTGHLPAPAVATLRAIERRLVRRCDLVVTVGGKLAEHYRGLGARRTVIAGNWKDSAEFQFDPQTHLQTRASLGLNGSMAICFIANLGPERHLEPLMRAVAADSRFSCVIGGAGPQAELVRRYAAQHDNIRYLGRVRPADVPRLTAACDIVYYGFDRSNPNARWSAPNKLYEAIAAGKPFLGGDFGEVGDTIRAVGCGVLADTSTPRGIATALDRLADRRALAEMGDRAAAAREQFSRRSADAAIIAAYDTLLWRRREAA